MTDDYLKARDAAAEEILNRACGSRIPMDTLDRRRAFNLMIMKDMADWANQRSQDEVADLIYALKEFMRTRPKGKDSPGKNAIWFTTGEAVLKKWNH